MKPLTIAVILTVGLATSFASTRASAQPPPPGRQRPGAQGQPAPGQPGAPAPDTKNASISGRVFAGDTGSPLRNAEVQLFSRESRTSAGTTTDDQGRFDFTELAGGRYRSARARADTSR